MSKQAMKEGTFVAIPKCYYCNKDKDILIHKQFKDISAAHGTIIDTVPCDECAKYMDMGVILVSIRDGEKQEGNPPNPYRTGGFWVISCEAAQRIFNMDTDHQRFAFIEDSTAEKIGLEKAPQSDNKEGG